MHARLGDRCSLWDERWGHHLFHGCDGMLTQYAHDSGPVFKLLPCTDALLTGMVVSLRPLDGTGARVA